MNTPGATNSPGAARPSGKPRSRGAAATGLDLTRQIAVLCALGFTLVAVLVGVGGLGGTEVDESQGGRLSEQGSFLAPAGPAFSIWTVIYAGLIGYAIWQALPGQRASERHRAVGWWIALTIVLNGLWLVAAQFLTIEWTVVVILLLLIALGITFHFSVVTRTPRAGFWDALLIDGVTGLHLGWVTLASVANIAAWLTGVVPEAWADAAAAWGVAVLVVVAVIGLGIAWASGWRIAPGLALAWGLCWLAVGRLGGDPRNGAIGITAIIVAAIVLLIPLVIAGLRLLRPEHD
ncbi:MULTISPECIES: tryptophan-rich sensory protein [unclassified Microbacterium]|uniref:tryptophan-rich sensory protein n=1 Tax=unclassified Microbacterium TaxID=2609290 RepID=UPI00214AA599|nr:MULTISPECIES: tryptophan-rich sensory protein [unclassified Microbacterium]MCR2808682.1 tryptophan-rich sensory protein [Microbacterium sp. zg.B185]WIM18886.1 tryptophan-rich sensory protein [Microbacterium sp. zg-B185]